MYSPVADRAGHGLLHAARRRSRDLGAALHLPRFPLCGDRRLAGRAACRPTWKRSYATRTSSVQGGSSAPTRWSIACTRTSCGACGATSSISPPIARSATSGWDGPATSRCSPRPLRSCSRRAGFLASWLADLAAEQRELGVVPLVVPNTLGSSTPPAAAWGDAAVIVPWVLYQRYGDAELLATPVRQHARLGRLDRSDGRPVSTSGTRASSSATGLIRPRRRTTRRRRAPTPRSSLPPTWRIPPSYWDARPASSAVPRTSTTT